MSTKIRSAVDFYERHPITADIIKTRLLADQGSLDRITPEMLWPHDQDHYGGLEANETIATDSGLPPKSKVADFCAGLGGPARYYAATRGWDVTGIELTPSRVKGGNYLSALCGLQHVVRIIEGDVRNVALSDGSMDGVVSQEAFLHVPDLQRAFAEASRILKPGGVFVFSTWTAPKPLSEADTSLLWDGMAVAQIYSENVLASMLTAEGFAVTRQTDLSQWWGQILAERLRMYRNLRQEAINADTPAGHDDFYLSYVLFVDLVQSGGLGGVRIAARKS